MVGHNGRGQFTSPTAIKQEHGMTLTAAGRRISGEPMTREQLLRTLGEVFATGAALLAMASAGQQSQE